MEDLNQESSTEDKNAGSKDSTEQKQVSQWQNRLLPWLIALPTLLILLFVFLATQQMQRFNDVIDQKSVSVIDALAPTKEDPQLYAQLNGNLDYIRWMSLAKMEEKSLDSRYSQGGLLLVSRIFTKYLGFFTGMILAMVGSVFIIGKFQEKTTEMEGEIGNEIKGKLASSSPGIIFGVLGTILMLSTILQHTEVAVTDSPLFLNSPNFYMNSASGGSPVNAIDPKIELDSVTISNLDNPF